MSLEPNGSDWRTIAPESIRSFTLPPDDERTLFVACSTYPAIDDEARYHLKVTKDVVDKMAKEGIGKPIIDAHGNNDLHAGTVVATAVDDQNRIWTANAINYDTVGNGVLKRMRDGQFKGVSWRTEGVSYQNPVDKQLQVEKSFVNLSLAQKPEYEEAKIYYIGDDPFPVKRNLTLHKIDKLINEVLSKKQTALSTETSNSELATESAVHMTDTTTNAAAAAAAVVATPAAVVATPVAAAAVAVPTAIPTEPVAKPADSMAVDAPQEKKPVEQQQQPPPPQQMYVQQPPVINYNFGVPFGAQNQFGGSSSAQSQPTQSTQDTMSSVPQQAAAAIATPAAAAEKVVEQPAAVAAATSTMPPKEYTDELRRSILEGVRGLFGEMEKSRSASAATPAAQPVAATPTPAAAAAVPVAATPSAAAADPAATQVPKLQTEHIHAAISRLGQMRNQIAEQQKAAEALAPMQSTQQRLEQTENLDAMKQEVMEVANLLIEGVEKHHSAFRSKFNIAGNSIVDNEVARMKSKLSQGQELSDEDMRWLGTTIEITAESNFGHQRAMEAQEARLMSERKRFAAQAPTGARAWGEVDALRKVLQLDPRSQSQQQQFTGMKRQSDSSFISEQQTKKKPTPTEEFQKKTGIPWKIQNPSELTVNSAPPPPTTSISSLQRDAGFRLAPVPIYQDSIWHNGLADDPTFAALITETRNQAAKGVEITQTLSREGWDHVERMNK